MEDNKPVKMNRSIEKPQDHKCSKCVWSQWINERKVLCTYSPIRCVKIDGRMEEEK